MNQEQWETMYEQFTKREQELCNEIAELKRELERTQLTLRLALRLLDEKPVP